MKRGKVKHYYLLAGQIKCDDLHFQCRSGQCISIFLYCDGNYNCKDHSDEEGCPVSKQVHCYADEVKCHESGECILKQWLCDGDLDCKDGSDEQVQIASVYFLVTRK